MRFNLKIAGNPGDIHDGDTVVVRGNGSLEGVLN